MTHNVKQPVGSQNAEAEFGPARWEELEVEDDLQRGHMAMECLYPWTHRLRVPGGWLYRVVVKSTDTEEDAPVFGIAMTTTFVPDPR